MDVAELPNVVAGEATSPRAANGAPGPVLVGLIGSGIAGSRSPALHMAEAAALGLHYLYTRIDLAALGLTEAALPELLTAARRFGFAGLNITHPCKQAVIPLLDRLSGDAAAIGAVNTVVFEPDGRSAGYNTDASGFAESFRRELPDVRRGRVALLGAGGAGAAVAHALLDLGVERISVVDVDRERADRLARALCAHFGDGRADAAGVPEAAIAGADGLVNATPIGMDRYPGMPVPDRLLRPDLWVADIIYFPAETELLRSARALGCRTMDGGGMAVFQAVGAFRLFAGLEPDAERMLRTFRSG